jgi:hypothetical protein
MLYRELLHAELQRQKEDFLDFSRSQKTEIERYRTLLRELSVTSPEKILDALSPEKGTGALPSAELKGDGSIAEPFSESWSNHEEARRWASKVLSGRTTFAADGSQLYAEKDVSLPVAAIQIGWFENPHDPARPYIKDADFRLLSPSELLDTGEDPANPETRVGEERFHAEVARVIEFLDRQKGWKQRGERMPLAFFDGTLLVSFSLPKTSLQKSFIEAMVRLVDASKETAVPVVGYIDRSLSRDLLNLLDVFGESEIRSGRTLYDSVFLESVSGVLPNWGDRTRFFYSNRKGMEAFSDASTGTSSVGFCYLATSRESSPARLDIPSWIWEDGYLEELADVVRAECVIGLGYPYPLETADATALISARDRQVFLKALQEFALREKLNFSVSRKDASKGRRR